mmetsp:Transcript_15347/g.53314  ORF Transcript_15347/g.53314 Transcript_15347/m.53314 type:complete len:202 (+) Transcript_15347:362-967(+)
MQQHVEVLGTHDEEAGARGREGDEVAVGAEARGRPVRRLVDQRLDCLARERPALVVVDAERRDDAVGRDGDEEHASGIRREHRPALAGEVGAGKRPRAAVGDVPNVDDAIDVDRHEHVARRRHDHAAHVRGVALEVTQHLVVVQRVVEDGTLVSGLCGRIQHAGMVVRRDDVARPVLARAHGLGHSATTHVEQPDLRAGTR